MMASVTEEKPINPESELVFRNSAAERFKILTSF